MDGRGERDLRNDEKERKRSGEKIDLLNKRYLRSGSQGGTIGLRGGGWG